MVPVVRERPPTTQKMSTAGPLGSGAAGPGASTINAKMSMRGPWEAVPEVQERPPSMQKTSTVALWEAVPEVRERPPST
jgi:hypothetical protein